MKNVITVLLLCLVFVACTEKNSTKFVEDIKEEIVLSPERSLTELNSEGTQIPLNNFDKILSYNDTALVFVNYKSKEIYLTDIKLNVLKYYDFKVKYDSLFYPRMENAFISKDTLFFDRHPFCLVKFNLNDETLKTIRINASPIRGPYRFYCSGRGNYIITFPGINIDDFLKSVSKTPLKWLVKKEAVLELKKWYEKFRNQDFITGVEVDPNGNLKNYFRLDKGSYDHKFANMDNARYLESGNKKYLYFEISNNIYALDESNNIQDKKQLVVNKNWRLPNEKDPSWFVMNNSPLAEFKNHFIHWCPQGPFILYNNDFEAVKKIKTDGAAWWPTHEFFVIKNKLVVFIHGIQKENKNRLLIYDIERIWEN